jgi:hypothetical protein
MAEAGDVQRICVFCGSRPGLDPQHVEAATAVGTTLARHGIGIVYGGASIGVMGALANAALAAGGEVIGVIPRSLFERETAHTGLTELRVVDTMHERKAMMADLSDAFVTLPGGIGTLEELFEVWTWAHLDIHRKPIGILNVAGFYDPLRQFMDAIVDAGFLVNKSRALVLEGDAPEELLARLVEATKPTEA